MDGGSDSECAGVPVCHCSRTAKIIRAELNNGLSEAVQTPTLPGKQAANGCLDYMS
jgi:hypothetical protein